MSIRINIDADTPEEALTFLRGIAAAPTETIKVGGMTHTRPHVKDEPATAPAADDAEVDTGTAGAADEGADVAPKGNPKVEVLPPEVEEQRPLLVAILVFYGNNPKGNRTELFAALADSGAAQGKIRAARELAIEHGLLTVAGSRGPHDVTEAGKAFAAGGGATATPAAADEGQAAAGDGGGSDAAAAPADPTPAGDEVPTVEEAKNLLVRVVKETPDGTATARKTLEIYGAQNISGVPEKKRAEFVGELQSVLDAAGVK